MKRPDHVRCENCVFWDKEDLTAAEGCGACSRTSPSAEQGTIWPFTQADHWCGEFRSEWPEEAK